MEKQMIKRKIICRGCQKEFEKMLPADISNMGRFYCPTCEQEAKQKGICVICKKEGIHLH